MGLQMDVAMELVSQLFGDTVLEDGACSESVIRRQAHNSQACDRNCWTSACCKCEQCLHVEHLRNCSYGLGVYTLMA